MVEQQVTESQNMITAQLEKHLKQTTEQTKATIFKEMDLVKQMAEHIKTTLMPENVQQVETMMKEFKEESKGSLDECLDYCHNQIK